MDASKTRLLLLGSVVVGLGIVLGTALWLKLGPSPQFGMEQTDSSDGIKQYGSVPDFLLTERNGSPVSLAELRGKIWIADFIYTKCTDTCPLQTAMMARLQEEYSSKPDVQLVSFTVDPERDTPDVLRSYAQAHGARGAGWAFLTGTPAEIKDVAQRYGVFARKTDRGDVDHTFLTSLVDRAGALRVQYMGVRFDPNEMLRDLHSLLREGSR